MTKFSSLAIVGIAFLAFAFYLSASSLFDIEFPIPELGNCADKDACQAYCDDLAHKTECVGFAKKHNLVDEETAEASEKLPPIGPGGCRSEEECRAYCEDSAHIEECVRFGEEHDLIDKGEAKRARDFAGQTGPGGCRGAVECREYCEAEEHKQECFEFANRRGLISDRAAEVHRRISEEGGPGGCKSEVECRTYCEDPSHLEECLAFGERHGFVSKDEAARVRKQGLVSGPGGCKFDECRTYCEDPAHQNECIDWAVENGFMSREDAERSRKFAGKTGPGGCTGEECRTFCEKTENIEACVEFAEREGLISGSEAERARKFSRIVQEGGPGGCRGPEECSRFCSDPARAEACFEFAKKNGLIPPGEEKQFETGIKLQRRMQESGGPGGCRTEEACQTYCSDPAHVEECIAFAAAHGGIPESEARRMLEEFTHERFEARGEFRHPEAIRHFKEEARKRFEGFRQGADEFGRCVEEAVKQVPRTLLESDPQAFVTKKEEAIRQCHERFKGGFPGMPPQGNVPPEGFPQPGVSPRPCPLAPTVDSCPSGMRKEPAFSSPECGTYYKCVLESTSFPDPARICAEKGGSWDGFTCRLPEGTSSLQDPARSCAEKGGTWDGASCRLPAVSPGVRAPTLGGFFALLIQFLLGR